MFLKNANINGTEKYPTQFTLNLGGEDKQSIFYLVKD